jgi:L-amino acid N-acyltransferase YncA
MKSKLEEPIVRVADHADAASILDIYAPIVTGTAISFEENVPTREEIERRIATSHVWFVVETVGGVGGYAYAGRFHPRDAYRWSAEVSVYVAERARGQGLARKLIDSALDWLLEHGYVNAFAGITLPNPASVGLFESLGFETIGVQRQAGFKMGAWHDVGWWQRMLREQPVPPPGLKP